MQQNSPSNHVRLNIQITPDLKRKLAEVSTREGKKISVLVRESIEENLKRIERKVFEEKMKQAYVDLSQENLDVSEDFKYVDAENLS
jgi:predicted DNA-binding protein